VDQDIAQTGDRAKLRGEIGRQNSQLSHAQNRFMLVTRLLGPLDPSGAVADLDAALRGHLTLRGEQVHDPDLRLGAHDRLQA